MEKRKRERTKKKRKSNYCNEVEAYKMAIIGYKKLIADHSPPGSHIDTLEVVMMQPNLYNLLPNYSFDM